MTGYLLLALTLSFLITFVTVPRAIEKLSTSGKTVKDIYKKDNPQIPTNGAIVVFFTVLVVCATWPLLNRIVNRIIGQTELVFVDSTDITILLVISLFAIFGIIDDLLDLSWSAKLFVPLLFSFPIFIIYDPTYIEIPFYGIYDMSTDFIFDLAISDVFKLFVIPLYIMVVPNLINMHSGYNGLQTGLSSILLGSILIKCIIDSNIDNLLVPSTFLGGMFAFWYYNKYPANIFEGNIGSLCMGSIVGIILVLKDYYFFGIFILIPHIVDFLMLIYLRVKSLPFIKFGKIDDKGIIIAPNPIKMKFLLPYYFRMTEPQVVKYLYLITIIFCCGGILFL